ncbi:MAG: tetratricopeptide repeat protein [Gemmatimonadetes bacterium]|nr:tetratricopeptide repeat protein [Gemmatimonadota bacterium]
MPAPPAPGQATGLPSGPALPPGAAEPSPDQVMDLSLQQLRRGSPGTARVGFTEFLRRFGGHPRAADAEFFIGEAWAAEQRPDSAAAAYRRVVQRYAASPRAASALYKLGLQAAAAGRRDEARGHFSRLLSAYPVSEEAALARDQLRALAPAR